MGTDAPDAPDAPDALVLDLLEWIGPGERSASDVLDAWRTSCPRLPVWEEANDRGLLSTRFVPGRGRMVRVSAAGRAHLQAERARGGRLAPSSHH